MGVKKDFNNKKTLPFFLHFFNFFSGNESIILYFIFFPFI